MATKQKEQPSRTQTLLGIMLLLGIVAAVVQYALRPGVRPPPDSSGYYTGPMKSKGNPNMWGTDDGKRVDPPPGATGKPAETTDPAAKGKGKTAGPST